LWAVFLEVMRSGREAYYSPPSTAEVRTECIYIPIFLIFLHGVNMDHFLLLLALLVKCGMYVGPLPILLTSLPNNYSLTARHLRLHVPSYWQCHRFYVQINRSSVSSLSVTEQCRGSSH
jgi:hypothetical protein